MRGRAYYFRRCKKVPASNIESLPNEVLIEILVRLSVEEILENARFVCRHWYRTIHSDAFVNAHLHHHRDNWGLLLTSLHFKERPMFLCVRQGRIDVCKLYHKFLVPVPASCNGLVLSEEKLYTIHFVNLATKQASCDILTAGVDNSWRSVGIDHLSCGAKKLLLLNTPLITRGFMHWTWEWEGTRVLTLNAETDYLQSTSSGLVLD